MSSTPVTDVAHLASQHVSQHVSRPRVRHQAREAVALMAFSATTSLTLAGVLVLLAHWGR